MPDRSRRMSLTLATVLVALAGLPAVAQTTATPAPAAPTAAPTDPVEAAILAYTQKMAAMREAGTLNAETRGELIKHALDGIDPSALTLAQTQRIINGGLYTPLTGKNDAINARLEELAQSPDEQGAAAACTRLMALTRTAPDARGGSEAVAAHLTTALEHPGLPAAIKTGSAAPLMTAIGNLNDKTAFAMCTEGVFGLAMGLGADASPKMLTGINSLVQGLRGAEADAYRIEEARAHLVEVAAAAIAKGKENPEFMTAQEVTRLQRQHDLLDGAWGRGQLIGYEAPSISFDWSTDPKVTSLDDLRGSVVVIDFWATWCGPCRSSFPKVAELVQRYEGYPVRVIGVTSLQGYHISSDTDENLRIDCANDPQKEYGLMPEFMSEMSMNWDVMFSPTNVFNPQYGVNGIPHVAIIAPDGTVRHNGLHPANPLAAKAELIDAILAEFNLPKPPPVEVADPAAAPAGGE